MKRAFTVYYDASDFATDNEAMLYKITSSKSFEGEDELIKAFILRDCSQHFTTAYNDGDPLSLEQLDGGYVGYAHDETTIEKEARNETDNA